MNKAHLLDKEVFTDSEVERLYRARVSDNQNKFEEFQLKRFKDYCTV